MPIVAGLALLVALMLLGRWLTTSNPKAVIRSTKWAVVFVLAAAVVLLVVTGRAGWALAALAGLLPWISKAIRAHGFYRAVRSMLGGGAKAGDGNRSTVKTRFLSMSLDTATGALAGLVLEGPYQGRELASLSFDELLELRRQCAADIQSVQILDAFLDRTWPDWRQNSGGEQRAGGVSSSGGMSRDEALAVLGLGPDAGIDEIKAAHRRLMATAHPDRGGSNYLASKINQAKDTLLSD